MPAEQVTGPTATQNSPFLQFERTLMALTIASFCGWTFSLQPQSTMHNVYFWPRGNTSSINSSQSDCTDLWHEGSGTLNLAHSLLVVLSLNRFPTVLTGSAILVVHVVGGWLSG